MNDQLVSHIKQRLAQNMLHDDIVKELLVAGWKQEDVDAAFGIAQGSPQFPSVAPAAQPTGVAEQSAQTPIVPDTNPAETYSAPITMSATSTDTARTADGGAFGATVSPNKLPGVFALLKGGFAIYKERLGVLVGIGAMRFLLSLFFGGLIIGSVVLGIILLVHPSVIITFVFAIITLLIVAVMVWLLFWITLAGMQAIRGHKEEVTFVTAFGSARSLVWSFLWLSIIVVLVSSGGIFIFSILPGALLALLGFLSPVALIIPGIYLVVSLAIFASLFGTWFIFSGWVFLTESLRGIHALMASRELVRGRFWKIYGRAWGIFFVIGFGMWVFKFVFTLILFFIPMVSGIVVMIASMLFFMPFALATVYFLYENVRLQVPVIPESPPKVHKAFVPYAIVGVVAVIAFLMLPPIISSSLHHARQIGNDGTIKSDVSTMQLQLEIDGGVAPGTYPVSLTKAAQADPTIAILLKHLQESGAHYTYQSTGSTYTFCATLSTGSQFCANSSGKTFTK